MRSLLVGNGVIIQYGGTAYLNSSIINRALEKIRTRRFPEKLYPSKCADLTKALQREHTAVLRGDYNGYAYTTYDRSALKDLKKRYSICRQYTVDEIGFEDYFLILELVHNKLGVGNPVRFNNRGFLRRMFLDVIYDDGNIESIYRNFTPGLVGFLQSFDQMFTTNYDSNLEEASGMEVHHLHGSFRTVSDVYKPDNLRNHLSDDLLNGEKVLLTLCIYTQIVWFHTSVI